MEDARFERLYAEHAQAVFAFLVYRTGDRHLSEDLLAEVFERALRAGRARTALIRDDRAWIFTVAVNRLRDHQRRDRVRRAAEADLERDVGLLSEPDPGSRLAERDWLVRGLDALTREEREAVALRFGADLSLRQIATVTGTSQTTAEGRLYRALRKLRDCLSDLDGPEPAPTASSRS